MKTKATLIFLMILILLSCDSKLNEGKNTNENTNNIELPEVAILGVFHFGSTTDLSAINMENILGEKRQSEIKELITKIEKFKPSKILVEYPYSKTDKIDSIYNRFLSNEYSLTTNEIDQIGFRLAQNLGHNKLYGIDYRMNLPSAELFEYCQKNDQMENFKAFTNYIKIYTSNETELLSKMTLAEYFAHMNTDKTDRITNELYLKNTLSFGDIDNEVGANFTAMWYKRNLIILNNIAKVINGKNERVLVIIGSAHRALIKGFIENRNDIKYIEIGSYLN